MIEFQRMVVAERMRERTNEADRARLAREVTRARAADAGRAGRTAERPTALAALRLLPTAVAVAVADAARTAIAAAVSIRGHDTADADCADCVR